MTNAFWNHLRYMNRDLPMFNIIGLALSVAMVTSRLSPSPEVAKAARSAIGGVLNGAFSAD